MRQLLFWLSSEMEFCIKGNDFAGLRPKRFPCYSSSFVMHLLLHIWCLCCPNMFVISSSFGATTRTFNVHNRSGICCGHMRTSAYICVNHCGSWRMSADVRYESADVRAFVKACGVLWTFFPYQLGLSFSGRPQLYASKPAESAKACIKF